MKRLLLILIALSLCGNSTYARRKTPKAGEVDGNVYTDVRYDFKLTIGDNWKSKVRKDKENYRLVLVQKNYEIPAIYLDADDYTQVPRLVVWADTTSMRVGPFLDSLLSESWDSDQKNDIYKEFDIINENSAGSGTYREPIIAKGRRTFELSGEKAIRWNADVPYRTTVALSASSEDGKRVRGGWAGLIVAVKKKNVIMLFHLICERDFQDAVEKEVLDMVSTLEWVEGGEKGK